MFRLLLFRICFSVFYYSGFVSPYSTVPRSAVPYFTATQFINVFLNLDKYFVSGGIRIRIPQELDVVAFWSWNLDVVVFWSWNLDVVVYVPPRPRFRYHRENKKITHNYVNYVVEKYFSCPNLCNNCLHNVCISKLE